MPVDTEVAQSLYLDRLRGWRKHMCETNVYIYKDGKEDLYLESVDVLIPEGGKVHLKNLFGEQKTFEGQIREISLLKRRILLEEKKSGI